MKRTMMVSLVVALLGTGGVARAADPATAPDCSEKQKALDDAKTQQKEAASAKPDLSSCKDLKGQEKKDCEAPLKEKVKSEEKMAKDNVSAAKTALACCKKPDKKGCAP